MSGMSLEDAARASREHADRLAREEAEHVHGLTGDALVALLLQRARDARRRLRDHRREHEALCVKHNDLRARYRRLAALLQQPDDLDPEEFP